MCGALVQYISHADEKHFQPMSSNMGILTPLDVRIKDKKEKYTLLAERGLSVIQSMLRDIKGKE